MKKLSFHSIHLFILYFLLSLFILGSLYHSQLITNLSLGFYFTLGWASSFIVAPSILYMFTKSRINQINQIYLRNSKFSFFASDSSQLILFLFYELILLWLSIYCIPQFFNVQYSFVIALILIALSFIMDKFVLRIEHREHKILILVFNTVYYLFVLYCFWFFLFFNLSILLMSFTAMNYHHVITISVILLFLIANLIVIKSPWKSMSLLLWRMLVGFIVMAAIVGMLSYVLIR